MATTLRATALLLLAATLSACGGGGGSAAPATFPLRTALDTLTRTGSAFQLKATGTSATSAADGDCSGTMNETDGAATIPATFNGKPGWSSSIIASLHFDNCTPADVTAAETDYFDSNYLPLGAVVSGGKYGVYLAPPVVPETVSVGDSGTIGTLTFQVSSSDTTAAGHADRTYAIEKDGDSVTTAIANSISRVYDASPTPVLTSTSQVRYRIDTKGKLSIVSQDIKTPTTHLVFRCAQSSC
jgi:hypothetical protein